VANNFVVLLDFAEREFTLFGYQGKFLAHANDYHPVLRVGRFAPSHDFLVIGRAPPCVWKSRIAANRYGAIPFMWLPYDFRSIRLPLGTELRGG
jgi:hypothetical protein